MYYLIKFIFLLLICCVASCTTTKSSSDEVDNDSATQVKTAKINARLGIAYLEQHDIQLAKQKLLLAIDQAPHIPEPWYSMAYFYETTGNKETAKSYYLKAIHLGSARGDVQNNYGTFLCRSGNPKEAIQHFLLAVKDPEYLETAGAYENAGLCALKIPNQPLAAKYFQQALMHDPARAVSLLELAQINYQQGHYTTAKNQLKEYLLIGSTTPATKHLAELLDQKIGSKPPI